MPATTYTAEQLRRLGQERYERDLRRGLEAQHHGQFLAIDVETGEYAIDSDDVVAVNRVAGDRDSAPIYLLRIGYRAAHRLLSVRPHR